MKMILIAGLGNPGKKYEKTRHNAGFIFVDYLWKKHRDKFSFSNWEENRKLKSEISFGKAEGKKIILLKPQTFMNSSGEAVKAALRYYKIKLSELIVVHDEIDLPLGKYRISTNRSSAGHRGVQNIIETLETKNFTRLRIGIGNRTNKKASIEKYVLGKFADKEFRVFRKILKGSANDLQEKIK